MYTAPTRHYHNFQHIADCLEQFSLVRSLATDPLAVELAIWFHDAVYDTRAGDNEERSAELASSWLRPVALQTTLVDSVCQLVLATKAHKAGSHPDAALLVDVDLSILGQAEEKFWDYERKIREEYAWVESGLFAVKRAEILENFLNRPQLYQTDLFRTRLERQARTNLQTSIKRLRGL